MKILLAVMMLAGTVWGQTTRPAAATIAELKQEVAKLRAENSELKQAIARLDPLAKANPGPAEFSSLAAFVKWFPKSIVRDGGDTNLRDQEKARWVADNAAGKTIRIVGAMYEAEADEIGQIELKLQGLDEKAGCVYEISAKFVGTAEQRKALASVKRGNSIKLVGRIADAMILPAGVVIDASGHGAPKAMLWLDQCEIEK
jgi:hypothetical protein